MPRLTDIFLAGGPVMWPLLAMSILSVALSIERTMFWLSRRGRVSGAWLDKVAESLTRGDWEAASRQVHNSPSVHAQFVAPLLPLSKEGREAAVIEGVARERVEALRSTVERFSVTLSAIITAAPMLGILGTVTGIIASFQVLSGADMRDPGAVAGGVAEALITTAFGLIVALVTLFPYTAFRTQADRCFNRFEVLAGLIVSASRPVRDGPSAQPAPASPARSSPAP